MTHGLGQKQGLKNVRRPPYVGSLSLWVTFSCVSCSYFRADNSAWTPANSGLAWRAPEVSRRFGLERRFQLTLRLSDALSWSSQQAVARAQLGLARLPGVRSVAGPSGLRTFSIDEKGRLSSMPLLPAVAARDEEIIRERIEHRADAAGWFIPPGGTEIRMFIEVDDIEAIRPRIAPALAAAGLDPVAGQLMVQALLPKPDRGAIGPYPPWFPVAVVLWVASVFALPALYLAQPQLSRALLASLVAGFATASVGVFAPVVPIRRYAILAGVVVVAWVMLLATAMGRLRRRRPDGSPPFSLPLALPRTIGVPCALVAMLVMATWPRLGLSTRLWEPGSLFFISVRADLDQPVVMRELRRLADFVREQPGVGAAWSIADTVESARASGFEAPGIPDREETLRARLFEMRGSDDAARLQLADDHDEGLIVARWDDHAGIDRTIVQGRIEKYIEDEQRSTLIGVDLSDERVPVAARGFARGILAMDERTRVLRSCARFGRNLDDDAVATTERLIRQAVLAPAVELPALRLELQHEVFQFLEEMAPLTGHDVVPPGASARQRLADALSAQPWQNSTADISSIAATTVGLDRTLGATVEAHRQELRSRLATVRRRNAGRVTARALLAELDLPAEGELSDEVRDAALEALGPIAGVPSGVPVPSPAQTTLDSVPASAHAPFFIDSFVVGGVAQDAALSRAWLPRLWLGVTAGCLFMACVLLTLGGAAALGWWPAALGPCAAALAVPVIAGVSIGIWPVAVAAGALAGGAAFAVLLAPRWAES